MLILFLTLGLALPAHAARKAPAVRQSDKSVVPAAKTAATRDDPPPSPAPEPPPSSGHKCWMDVLWERFLRRCENPWADDPADRKR